MNPTDNESLGTGAPSQNGDSGRSTSERERDDAAAASDRVDEAAPRHSDAGDESGNPPGLDRSLDRGMASPGAASQADASARHAAENLPDADKTPKR